MWAAGLSLCLVAAVLVVLTRDGRHDVAPRPVDVPRASPRDAAVALASFVAGVEGRDEHALVSLAAPSESSREVLAGIARNARTLDLTQVDARYVDQVGTVARDGVWSGVAEISWRLGGFDGSASRADVVVTFAPDGDGVGIVGFDAGERGPGSRVPLWLRGPLSVARARDVLVLADGARSEAQAVARRVTRGISVVRGVLRGWRSPVVVEVPASAAELDETLGVDPGTYASIAAVTAPAGSASNGPVHVFLNPEVTAGLRRAGAQVVMSHELVHVATDAARSPMETWLLEGFADYVALRATRLPDKTTLRRAIESVRRDGVPDELPMAADFDTRAGDLQARYEEAWLACRIIAERLGERTLVEVYDAASGGEALKRVLRRAGLPLVELTHAWRSRLRELAG